MRWRPGSVHGTAADALAEQNRRQVAPTMPARPPPADHSSSIRFPFGPVTRWRRVQSRGALGAAELFNVARRQVPTVRKRRREGDAMASQWAARAPVRPPGHAAG